jgi:ryanodine receptor 2
MPNILVGLIDGSSLFKRWYFEAEVEHVEACGPSAPYLRIGWANTVGFKVPILNERILTIQIII